MQPNTVRKIKLPAQSVLWQHVGQGDFLDCYAVRSDMAPRPAAQIITDFPGWAQMLLRIRRVLTEPFGLSNDGPEASDKLGIFPVDTETKDEVLVGFNDRHLNFRVSVRAQAGEVTLATWVHPHNFGGRAYLRLILPFHVLIVRNALARVRSAA